MALGHGDAWLARQCAKHGQAGRLEDRVAAHRCVRGAADAVEHDARERDAWVEALEAEHHRTDRACGGACVDRAVQQS